MATPLATFSVCEALRTYLQQAYDVAPLRHLRGAAFRVVSSDAINRAPPESEDVVTILLYRITVNEHQRNTSRDPYRERVPLTLDLHLLLTAWCGAPNSEQALMTWTMHELYQRPELDLSLLPRDDGWLPEDVVQIVPAELSNEDMMRIWDALTPPYHLSVSYVARLVRIDVEPLPTYPPVVAKRIQIEEIPRPDRLAGGEESRL